MVRNDIFGGLKVALSKGSSLQEAMQSFYNAGYKKEDIEEAARNLQSQPVALAPVSVQLKKEPLMQNKNSSTAMPKKKQMYIPSNSNSQFPSKEELTQVFSQQRPPNPFAKTAVQQTNVKQNVSSYGEKPKIDAFTIILVSILIVLIGILVCVFLFKDQLVEFLNGFLS